MKLLLIRHGLSVGNSEGIIQGHSDFPLTSTGREQAQALARRLHDEAWPLAAVYASDLSRASETAQIVAEVVGRPAQLDPRLREYDFGVLNGLVWRSVEVLYPDIWQRFHDAQEWGPIPGEEGEAAFVTRVSAALDEILANHRHDDAVALVGHGGSLGILLCQLLGLPARRPTPFRLDNASLSIVNLRRRPVLTLVNDTCHLTS